MPFTLEQRYKVLTHLNLALLRSHQMRANWEDYSGDFWRLNAKLTPTEYQENRPVPLLFEEDDIWARLNGIEAKSQYLVTQVIDVIERLDKMKQALDDTMSSANYAMTRADVIEWDVRFKTSGIDKRQDQAIEDLRYFLGLPPTPTIAGGGTARS
jgi:hypothetical protein